MGQLITYTDGNPYSMPEEFVEIMYGLHDVTHFPVEDRMSFFYTKTTVITLTI